MHIHRYIIRPAPPPGMDFFLARNTHNLFHQDENSLHTEAGSTQKEASKFLGLASVFFFAVAFHRLAQYALAERTEKRCYREHYPSFCGSANLSGTGMERWIPVE